jgi:hypothetical protein
MNIKSDILLEKIYSELEKFLRLVLLKLHADADRIIRDEGAVASGEMVKNLREDVYREAGKLVGVFGVGGNVKYGLFRHEGTKPHFPPIEPILKWVLKKGLVQHNSRPTSMKALWRTKKGADTLSEAKTIAFLISRAIGRRGTKGLQFLKLALAQNTDFIISKLSTVKI